MTLQTFLATRDIELTLLNDHDEAVYIGKAVTVKPLKEKHYLRFSLIAEEHIFPYTKAVLHSGSKIFTSLIISPLRLTNERSIELVY